MKPMVYKAKIARDQALACRRDGLFFKNYLAQALLFTGFPEMTACKTNHSGGRKIDFDRILD
jgi:hypothetical protein